MSRLSKVPWLEGLLIKTHDHARIARPTTDNWHQSQPRRADCCYRAENGLRCCRASLIAMRDQTLQRLAWPTVITDLLVLSALQQLPRRLPCSCLSQPRGACRCTSPSPPRWCSSAHGQRQSDVPHHKISDTGAAHRLRVQRSVPGPAVRPFAFIKPRFPYIFA